jgi:hypothetical protein
VVVTGGGPLSRQAALARFAALPGYEPMAVEPGLFGTLGRLVLGEGVRVDLVELPGDPAQRPLWRPFGAGAVGALVLLPAEGDGLLDELVRVLQVPVVVCGPVGTELPAPLRDASGGVAFGGSDAAEALRALLAGAGARAAAY